MENENNAVSTPIAEESFMPEGWDGKSDFFAWAESLDKADESASLEDAFGLNEKSTETDTETSTTGTEETGTEKPAEAEPVKVEEPKPEKPEALRFKVSINHKTQDIELDPSELPDLYQKKYIAEKRLAKLNNRLEKAELVSELLGYSNIDEMLDAAKTSYEDGEIERLKGEHMHPESAKDLVARKVKEAEERAAKKRVPVEEEPESSTDGGRDFRAEAKRLTEAYPELAGKEIPDEVARDAISSGRTMLEAYMLFKMKSQPTADEVSKLRKENQVLKQNAEAAKRAPVRSTTKGGATDVEPDDPFLKGFGSY